MGKSSRPSRLLRLREWPYWISNCLEINSSDFPKFTMVCVERRFASPTIEYMSSNYIACLDSDHR